MEIIVGIIVFFFYFLPSFIGWNKRNAGAILMLNFLLGWTLIGWIVALIWSLTNDVTIPKVVYVEKEKDNQENQENDHKKESGVALYCFKANSLREGGFVKSFSSFLLI